MTLSVITIAVNVLTIAMLVGIIATSQRTYANMRKQTKMIASYRHDIAWLTARLGQLEMEVEARVKEGKL